MMKPQAIVAVVVLVICVGAVVAFKNLNRSEGDPAGGGALIQADSPILPPTELPRLLDLGAGKCIPCKKMVPILADLQHAYAGKLEVAVIDTQKFPEAARMYNINVIPTQIFYDASGREVFRHEGFWSKDDILGQWKQLGVTLD